MRRSAASAQGLIQVQHEPAGRKVGIETEVKVKIGEAQDFGLLLDALDPVTVSRRHFEDNYLLDFPDGKLSESQRMLRVRFADGLCSLTFKGPSKPEGLFKIREELETRLEDGSTALQIFNRLGFTICFQYQKYRQEYAIGETHVAVDETPIGNYVEFEGTEQGILDLTRRIGIEESQFLRFSYYSIYLKHCREIGVTPGFMVF
jgi:adenylate cyclase class 2